MIVALKIDSVIKCRHSNFTIQPHWLYLRMRGDEPMLLIKPRWSVPNGLLNFLCAQVFLVNINALTYKINHIEVDIGK